MKREVLDSLAGCLAVTGIVVVVLMIPAGLTAVALFVAAGWLGSVRVDD